MAPTTLPASARRHGGGGGKSSGWLWFVSLLVSITTATAAPNLSVEPAESVNGRSLCTKTRGTGCKGHTIWCASDGVGPRAPNFAVYGNLAAVTALIIESAPQLVELNSRALAGFERLASVNVTFTGLNEIADDAFEPVSATLLELTLSHNNLTALSEATFSRLTVLRRLDLSGNRLEAVDVEAAFGDGGLPALAHLDLSDNALSSLPSADALAGAPRLRSIWLHGNPIRRLEWLSLERLRELRSISFRSASLRCVDGAGREASLAVDKATADRTFAVCGADAAASSAWRRSHLVAAAASAAGNGCLCALSRCLDEPPRRPARSDRRRRNRKCYYNGTKADALSAAFPLRPLTRRKLTENELAPGERVVFDSAGASCEFKVGNGSDYKSSNDVKLTCLHKSQGSPVIYSDSRRQSKDISLRIPGERLSMTMAGSRKYTAVASDIDGSPVLYATGQDHSLVYGFFANRALAPERVHLPRITRCY